MKLPIPEIRENGPLPYITDIDWAEVQLAIERYACRIGKRQLNESEKQQAWLEHILEKYGS
jgi:hypothetical protein